MYVAAIKVTDTQNKYNSPSVHAQRINKAGKLCAECYHNHDQTKYCRNCVVGQLTLLVF